MRTRAHAIRSFARLCSSSMRLNFGFGVWFREWSNAWGSQPSKSLVLRFPGSFADRVLFSAAFHNIFYKCQPACRGMPSSLIFFS